MKELWVPLSAAIARQNQVDTIANNIANVNTPGFKKDRLAFKEYLQVQEKGLSDIDLPNKTWSPEDFYRTHGNENAQVKIDGTFTDFDQGSLTPTNGPLDLGIQGKGFFEIRTPQGLRYTRRGNFSISNEGKLTTDQGFPVLRKLNSPDENVLDITIPNAKISINEKGEIYAGNDLVGQISVVEFNDIHALQKENHSLFINPEEENIKREDINTRVAQGFLEQSNVNVIHEMSNLIKASRNFDSVQRVIKTYDSMAQKSNNSILRF